MRVLTGEGSRAFIVILTKARPSFPPLGGKGMRYMVRLQVV